MKPTPILALILAMVSATGITLASDDATRDFKAVDQALMRHPGNYTGNPDVDFRKQLIMRRQNIIDMSEVALARAQDPATEELANQTITRQKRDIAELQHWLDNHR